jgi:hypothetical protein
MSFTINNAKLEELQAAGHEDYGTQPSVADAAVANLASYYMSYDGVGGTTYGPSALVTPDTREHLLTLRRRIEGAGIPLMNAEELDSEIREMRR